MSSSASGMVGRGGGDGLTDINRLLDVRPFAGLLEPDAEGDAEIGQVAGPVGVFDGDGGHRFPA